MARKTDFAASLRRQEKLPSTKPDTLSSLISENWDRIERLKRRHGWQRIADYLAEDGISVKPNTLRKYHEAKRKERFIEEARPNLIARDESRPSAAQTLAKYRDRTETSERKGEEHRKRDSPRSMLPGDEPL